MMRIRRRDGSMADVDEDYVLQHGESIAIGPMFMDSARVEGKGQRIIGANVHDGRGNLAGFRPGFCYLGGRSAVLDKKLRDEAARAYEEKRGRLTAKWAGREQLFAGGTVKSC